MAVAVIVVLVGCSKGQTEVERGEAALKAGDNDLAVSCFTEAIRLDPKNAVAWDDRGDGYCGKKLYELAVSDYTEAIRLSPNSAQFYLDRGRAYTLSKAYDRAIADATKAISLGLVGWRSYYLRGNAYSRLEVDDKSVADLEKARQLAPDEPSVAVALSLVYGGFGRRCAAARAYKKAIAYFDRALAIGGEDNEVLSPLLGKAEAYFEMGDANSAKRTLAEYRKRFPGSSWGDDLDRRMKERMAAAEAEVAEKAKARQQIAELTEKLSKTSDPDEIMFLKHDRANEYMTLKDWDAAKKDILDVKKRRLDLGEVLEMQMKLFAPSEP